MRCLTWIYRTKASFKGHIIVGSVLPCFVLLAGALDIFIAPNWYVWHPDCDNPAIAMAALFVAPFYLVISIVLSTILSYFCVKGREGGKHILDFPFKPSLSGVFWNVVLLPPAAAMFYLTYDHLSNAGSTITQTVDCGGMAEPITSTKTWPIVQFGPLLSLCLAIWLLHLRSLVSTPYTPPAKSKV